MKITSTCLFDGNVYTMDFPNMTEAQFEAGKAARSNGTLIQDAFSFLTADEREFLMTGTPPQVWDELFSEMA
jgi:hypothetical protein